MGITIAGIYCDEIVDGFSEGFDLQQGPMARKGFICDWASRYTVAKGLLGLSTTTSVGGFITLQTPAQYPERTTMYALQISIEPKGRPFQSSPQLAWPKCIVWATYGMLPWSFQGFDQQLTYNQIDPGTPLIYCRQNMNVSTTYITIPGRGLYFIEGGIGANPVGQDVSIPVPVIDFQITFIRVPYLPSQQVLIAATNPLNSAKFLGCQAGSVLFNGMQNEQTRDTDGNFNQDCTMSFSFRGVNWDAQWNPQVRKFEMVGMADGTPILGRSDLNALLIPGYLI